MGKTALYLGCFCLYSVILLVIGKSSLHGSNTPGDYFICEKKVSLPFCAATFTGTWVSAITILSFTGSIYEQGLSALAASVIPWFLGGFLMGFLIHLVYNSGAITVPEMFGRLFHSRRLQAAYGAVFIGIYVFYLVTQYKGFGMIASELFEIPYQVAVLLVCLFILYTTLGGYRSVLRTDMMNLILLIVSLIGICAYLTGRAGGFGELYRQAASIQGAAHPGAVPTESGQMLSLFGNRSTPLVTLSMFWGWGLGVAANPQYLVRLMSAKDEKTARRTLVVSVGLLVVVYFCLIHIGLAMRVLVPSLAADVTTDGIFIRLINHELYSRWSALFFFAVIGACISTANSQLLIIASSFSWDILGVFVKKPLSGRKIVAWARFGVLAGGLAAMLLTLNPPASILAYGGAVWGIISILAVPPLYLRAAFGKGNARGVTWCLAVGLLSAAVFYPLYFRGAIQVHPAFPGFLVSTAALLLGSCERRRAK
jgi:Na+/proline symporter